MKKIISALSFTIFTLFVTLYCVTNPYSTANHCKVAILLCAHTAVPSLFMFSVLSNLISEITLKIPLSKNFVTRFISRIFRIEAQLVPVFLFGMFSGILPAFTATSEKVRRKEVSKESAENLLLLLSGCSIPFILTVCGAKLESFPLTLILILSNFLASFTSFFILCDKSEINTAHKNSVICNRRFPDILHSSLSISLHNTLIMCTYILFFYVLAGITSDILSTTLSAGNNVITAIVTAILEMTSGIAESNVFSGNEKAVFIAFTSAFSGISIIFQLDGICAQAGISIKKYIYSRLLCSVLCPLYMILFLLIFPHELSCFSGLSRHFQRSFFHGTELLISAFNVVVILFTAAVFLYIDKKHKKNVQK